MQDHGPDIGVKERTWVSDTGKVGGKLFKGRLSTKKHAIGITILKWHWMDLEIFWSKRFFRPMYFTIFRRFYILVSEVVY